MRYIIPPVTDIKQFTQAVCCQSVVYKYTDQEAGSATFWAVLLYNSAQYTCLDHLTMPHPRSYPQRKLLWPWSDAPLDALSMPSAAEVILDRSNPYFRPHAVCARCACNALHFGCRRWRVHSAMRRHASNDGAAQPSPPLRCGNPKEGYCPFCTPACGCCCMTD